jgi:hypothetical protein
MKSLLRSRFRRSWSWNSWSGYGLHWGWLAWNRRLVENSARRNRNGLACLGRRQRWLSQGVLRFTLIILTVSFVTQTVEEANSALTSRQYAMELPTKPTMSYIVLPQHISISDRSPQVYEPESSLQNIKNTILWQQLWISSNISERWDCKNLFRAKCSRAVAFRRFIDICEPLGKDISGKAVVDDGYNAVGVRVPAVFPFWGKYVANDLTVKQTLSNVDISQKNRRSLRIIQSIVGDLGLLGCRTGCQDSLISSESRSSEQTSSKNCIEDSGLTRSSGPFYAVIIVLALLIAIGVKTAINGMESDGDFMLIAGTAISTGGAVVALIVILGHLSFSENRHAYGNLSGSTSCPVGAKDVRAAGIVMPKFVFRNIEPQMLAAVW